MILQYGWGILNKVTVEYLGTKPAAQALLDGLVDVSVVGAAMNPINKKILLHPQTAEPLASGKTVYFLHWGNEQSKKTMQKIPIIPITIPAGTIKGLDKDLPVFADTVAWCAAPEFPDDLAYEFVKLIVKNYSKFKTSRQNST